jgi:hypothetical protein
MMIALRRKHITQIAFVIAMLPVTTAVDAQDIPTANRDSEANVNWFDRIRPLDVLSAETLALGLAHSPLMWDLVARLELSDVIVHIETKTLLGDVSGTTRLAASTASYRYVRIVLSRDLMTVARTATLAHELQHAHEIAQSRARDARGMQALFSRIGRLRPGSITRFETDAAEKAGWSVWAELHTDSK